MAFIADPDKEVVLDPTVVRDPLTESFPNFAEQITAGRRRGLTDQTLQKAFDSKVAEAFSRGQSLDDLTTRIGATPQRLLGTLDDNTLRESEVGLQELFKRAKGQEFPALDPQGLTEPGLETPFVDPVFAGAGGFVAGGLGGAALALLTEPFLGTAVEQVTGAKGTAAGIITALLGGLGAGALERKALKLLTGRASAAKIKGLFDRKAKPTGAKPPPEPIIPPRLGTDVGGTPRTPGQGTPTSPASVPSVQKLVTPERIETLRRINKEFLKEAGGRPVTVDKLPQVSEDFARVTLKRFLNERRGLAPEEADTLLEGMNVLQVKNALAKLVKETEPPKKRGGQKKPGVAGESPDRAARVPSKILEETLVSPAVREVSEGLAEEVSRAKISTEATAAKLQVSTPDIKTFEKGTSGKGLGLKAINDTLNAADIRGMRVEYDLEEKVYNIKVDGDVVKVSNLADVEEEIARRGVVLREPVDSLPLELIGTKETTFSKVLNEEPLTRSDKKNLTRQKNSLKGGNRTPSVDPRLAEFEALGFTAAEIKAAEVGKLTPAAEKLLAAKMFDVGEIDDLTFGVGLGQIGARLEMEIKRMRGVTAKIKAKRKFSKRGKTAARLVQQGPSVKETQDFSLVLSYAKELGKDTPEGIASIMKSIGASDDLIEFITTRILARTPQKFTVPIVPGLLVDNPKINMFQTLINTQEAARNVADLGVEQFAQRFARDKNLNRRVAQLMRGDRSMKNATDAEKVAVQEWKNFAKDFAERTGLESDANYITRLTDFELLYDVFKKSLSDKSFSTLHPRFREQLGDAKTLDNLKRIFKGNTEWKTVQPADRIALKKAFNFSTAKTWEDLPEGVQESLPKEVFSPYLLPRTGKKVPVVNDMSQIISVYGKSMNKVIYNQPILDMGNKLLTTFENPERISDFSTLTDKAFIVRQMARVAGTPEADDKMISAFIQHTNRILGAQALSEAGFEAGTRLIHEGFLRGVIGPDSALVNLIMQPINIFMSSGRLGSALLKSFKTENKRDISKVRDLFGGTLDMMKKQRGIVERGTVPTEALNKYNDVMSKIFLSPLTQSEHVVRGMVIHAEMEAGIARGLDPVESFVLGANAASKVLPNLEMDDVLATAALQQAPQQLFVNPTRSGRAPIFTGKAGRLMMTLTSFPIGQAASIKKGLSRAIESGDDGRAARYFITLAAMLTLPTLVDELLGYDIRNFFSARNIHVQISGPFFKAVLNAAEAMGGRTISGRKKAGEEFQKYLRLVLQPQQRFTKKAVTAYDNAVRGYAVNKHMGRIRETDDMKELFAVLGIPQSSNRQDREARFQIGQTIAEYNFDRNEALEAIITGDQSKMDEFKTKWRTEIEHQQRTGTPIFTQKMIANKLADVNTQRIKSVPKALRANPEIQENVRVLKGEEKGFFEKMFDVIVPGGEAP